MLATVNLLPEHDTTVPYLHYELAPGNAANTGPEIRGRQTTKQLHVISF